MESSRYVFWGVKKANPLDCVKMAIEVQPTTDSGIEAALEKISKKTHQPKLKTSQFDTYFAQIFLICISSRNIWRIVSL